MTRTIRDDQLTDGQEIDVLVVSRDEAATAFGNLDCQIGGIGRSGDGGQAGIAEEEGRRHKRG